MENKTSSRFFELNPNRPDIKENQRMLFRLLQAALAYFPILLGLNAVGFIVIYTLGLAGLLDKDEPRLLIVAGISLLISLLHIPLFPLLRRGNLNLMSSLLLLIGSLGSASLVFLWQGIVWFPLLLTIGFILIFAAQNGIDRIYRWLSLIYGVLISIAILYADSILSYDRMHAADSITQLAALAIFFTITLAMIGLVLIKSVIPFRSISGRLVATFTFVAFLSAVATLIIAALASLFYDRQDVFEELDAANAARTSQIEVNLSNLERDASLTLADPLIDQRIHFLFSSQPGTPLYQVNNELVRAYLIRQQAQSTRYQEIMLLDVKGNAIISTTPSNEGRDFSKFNFFQNALMGVNSAIEFDFPTGFDKASIILVRPITLGGFIRGAIAARTNFDSIKQIMGTPLGVGETSETYLVSLVNGKIIPVTNTRKNTVEVNSLATQESIIQGINRGSGIYYNYIGNTVLGSFVRIPALKVALIAEVEQQEIINEKTLKVLVTNLIIGIFTALVAFTIVLITSRSISLPLIELAEKATALSNGELSTRMISDQDDEIGALATSFNTMANELQSLVRTLEQKVEDRTQAYQKQTNYLRVAADVARDSTNARDLNELLNNSAKMILDRFGYYFTGIYLLDEARDNAVLRAAPTEVGREMLARKYQLKVGGQGMVEYVAATGLPRFGLDVGTDVNFSKNPLLPNTRSQMALPLKVRDEVIGVLDIQSDQVEAFSQEDIAIQQTMADQLALAIQRMILAGQQERNLQELEKAYEQFTATSWRNVSQQQDFKPGYKYDGIRIAAVESFPEENREALQKGKTIVIREENGKQARGSSLIVPLKLRDQVIGALSIQFGIEEISSDTISLVEETATRLASSLENARLYTETQKLADRERAISEVSNRITTSVNIEEILRTAVQEIGKMLPDAEVVVRLQSGTKEE